MKYFLHFMFLLLASMPAAFGAEECDADNAERWKYLWDNPSLNLRQSIGAEVIKEKGIKSVVEVGGFCTPLCNYFRDASYFNIDPFVHSAKNYKCANPILIKEGVETVNFSKIPVTEPFALVIFGLYWEFIRDKDASQLAFIKDSLKKASLLILENVPNIDWLTTHRNQIIAAAKENGMKVIMDVNIDLLGEQPDPYAFYRQLIILSK